MNSSMLDLATVNCSSTHCFFMYSHYTFCRSRKLLLELKKKKAEFDDAIERLQKEAYLQVVKIEREKAEKERLKEEEERRRKRAAAQRIKRFLEAAFDGDLDEIKNILEEVCF